MKDTIIRESRSTWDVFLWTIFQYALISLKKNDKTSTVQENEWKKVMKKRVVECEIIQGREGCLSWRGGNRNRKVDTHSWGRTKSVYKWLWLGASFKHLGNGGTQSSNNSVPEKLETGDRCWTSLSSSEAPETAPAHEELPRLDPGHGVLRQISEEKRF